MPQNPASKETIQKLYENMGSNFSLFVPHLCNCASSLECLEQLNENESKYGDTLSFWKILLKLHIFSLTINLDLSTFLRADFRSTSNSEKRCNLKYVNVITIEGYSYLFGFGKDKNNSIWKTIKESTEQIDDEELTKYINDIEQLANKFEICHARREDRNNRNQSIHYDSDPLKVHNLLSQISEDTETIRTSAFLKILDDISVFTNKYIQKFQIPLIYSIDNYNIDIWERINHFPDENSKLFNELNEKLVHFAEQLDSIVAQCEIPKIAQEKLSLDDTFSESLQALVESIYPGIHMLYIYLDLACAIRAYLSSEFYFEKQLNLRRINIVVYEGFKHLYGYDNSDHLKSFWHRNISSILVDSPNTNLLDSLTKTERELKELAADSSINNEPLRECTVHYRYKDRDNVVTLFHALLKSNPLIEMNKSLKLLKLLPELLKINTESVSFKYNMEQEKIKSSNNKTLAQIDNTLSMIEQIKIDPERKQEMINNIKKLKNILQLF